MKKPIALSILTILAASATVGFSPFAPVAKEQFLVLDIENRGQITIQLHTDKAPKACAQIAGLAKSGFYDGQKFFKVVRSPRPFLAQLGDPQSKSKPITDANMGNGGTGAKIAFEESGFRHVKGAVGLAMKPDDAGTLFGDSQFYIMLGNAGFLDGKYTVFAVVTKGLDVLDTVEQGDVIKSVKLTN